MAWNVVFAINNKRKRIKSWIKDEEAMDCSTGKCGVEGLIWAKNGLLEFENFIKKEGLKQRIIVRWTDSKRKRVYKHYLEKEGYKLTIYYGKEFLIKIYKVKVIVRRKNNMEKDLKATIGLFIKWAKEKDVKDSFVNYIYWKDNIYLKR